MKQWYLSLPKFSKESTVKYIGSLNYEDIPKEKREFLSSLRMEIENPREYIFEKLFRIFGYRNFNIEVVEKIRECKGYYENLLESLEEKLLEDIRGIFGGTEEIGVISTLKDWEESLNSKTREHIFNKNENRVLELIRESGNNEKLFVEKLARVISSLRIEDWNRNTIERFLEELKNIKLSVEEFDKNLSSESQSESNSYKISFVNEEGKEQIRSFEKIECSRRATLLYNDLLSSIDEMGESISEQEIRQILMDILKNYC